jgi:Protein of unknown function (DUF3060)
MIIALLGAIVIGCLTFYLTRPSQSGPGGGLSSNISTSVDIPTTNTPTSNIPTTASVPPGGLLTISGIGGDETIACNDGDLTVTGKGHTLTVTGHCAHIEINAMSTHVTVDSVDEINVEGMDNVVIYHFGSPQVNRQGLNNSVEQG